MQNYSKNRQELIDEMMEEEGRVYCKICNTFNSFKFHCHHIIFRSEVRCHPEKHNKRNLIILCNECHENYHNDKHLRDDLVELRNLKQLFGWK
jgi:5-methylcytosine-specific restriction endonuclease McrA